MVRARVVRRRVGTIVGRRSARRAVVVMTRAVSTCEGKKASAVSD